jgi:transposase
MLWRQVQGARPRPPRRACRGRPRPRGGGDRDRTDDLNRHGDALCDLADVLAAAGRTDKAAETLEQALKRYERKKNLAMVAQIQPKLEELRKP